MRLIISPAKKMRAADDSLPSAGLPVMLAQAQELCAWINARSFDEQRRLWACSEAIARRSADQFAHMDLYAAQVPALLAYDGIQYAYMAPAVFEDGQLAYVQEHLRILSGFYGVLKPLDAVVPYRLEMQAKASVGGHANLYDFWGDSLYREVMAGNGDRVIVNLASKEYAKAIERHLQPGDTFLTCVFGELVDGRVVQKGVYVKMARGEMVRFLAGLGAQHLEQIKAFSWSDYAFDAARSTADTYVFTR